MNTSLLRSMYPNINFDSIFDEVDVGWHKMKRYTSHETLLLNRRIDVLKKYIKESDKTDFAIVGHCSYFNMLLRGIPNTEHIVGNTGPVELKHCYPYKITL